MPAGISALLGEINLELSSSTSKDSRVNRLSFLFMFGLSLLLPRPALGRVKNTIDVLFDNAVFLHLLLGLPIIFIQFGFPVV